MTAPFKALLVLVAVLAIATLLNALVVQRVEVAVGLGVVAGLLIGIAVGVAVRPRVAPTASIDERSEFQALNLVEPRAAPPTLDSAAADALGEDDPVIVFAQELVGATTTDRFRRVVATHLPPLVGTTRVWIAGRVRGSRQLLVPERPEGSTSEDLLDGEGREWTTFGLRVDNETVGVLGLETRGGLTPEVRRVIRRVAPMIAQAMTTAQAIDSLRERSLVDLLTGLATRTEGMLRLESEIKRAQRSGTSMAVLMLDLDQFKSINDRFGHAVGDAMLAVVGRTIMRTLRATDVRVRWGGEEFLVVLPETDLPRAQVVAKGLLREISAAAVATPSGPVGSTVSIGITISRQGETDAAAMLRRADTALYRAKAAGRACVRVVLAERPGSPVGVSPTPGPSVPHAATLPFPDRRNPHRTDRRRVPGSGRRSTDPSPADTAADSPARRENPQAQSLRR
jgi:diguanylate cyclase (GGDEF)-like protein